MAGVETKYINFCGVTSVGCYVWVQRPGPASVTKEENLVIEVDVPYCVAPATPDVHDSPERLRPCRTLQGLGQGSLSGRASV